VPHLLLLLVLGGAQQFHITFSQNVNGKQTYRFDRNKKTQNCLYCALSITVKKNQNLSYMTLLVTSTRLF